MSSFLRIADDRGRWAVIAADASVIVPERRLGVTGINYFVSFRTTAGNIFKATFSIFHHPSFCHKLSHKSTEVLSKYVETFLYSTNQSGII